MGGSTTAKRGDARSTSRRSSHLQHEAIGVLLIALGLLALLSLVSFSPFDAFLFSGAPHLASSGSGNLIGAAGATLAGSLFWLVGGAGYLLPFLLAMVGVHSFREGTWNLTLRRAGGSLCALMCLSGLFHLEVIGVPTWSSGWVYRGMAGGKIGEYLAEGLRGYFASTGAHILITSGFLISLLFATTVSFADLATKISGWMTVLEKFLSRLRKGFTQALKRVSRFKKKIAKLPSLKINKPVPTKADDPEHALNLSTPSPDQEAPPPQEIPIEVQDLLVEDDPPIVLEESVSTGYRKPDPLELLADPSAPPVRMSHAELKAQSEVLIRALQSFGIDGRVTDVHPGPVVTMYEFEPAPGVKVARIVNLDSDLALALKATSLRIVAPIPGKSVVGIEVPNRNRETVLLKEVLGSEVFVQSRSKLTFALGKDIFGKPVTVDLKTMPHLLVAGATGAGKSVSLNTMLLSILCAARPDEVKLLLIDPKMLEFQLYEGLPHLIRPVITNAKAAAKGLGWMVQEMERRYKLLAVAGVRNIEDYNRWVAKDQGVVQEGALTDQSEQSELPIEFLSEEARLSAGESAASSGGPGVHVNTPDTPSAPLPYIVVMIDELADLMMVAPKDVEDKIARLAQMARASGIHLVLATQRPSVDVLTGLIKANFPARISFQVSSKTDSRTILDANGAEALVGRGDMLYLASGTGRLVRLHGSYAADTDVRRVVEFIKGQSSPAHHEDVMSPNHEEKEAEEERDEIYEQARELVLTSGQASASLIQRRLRVGYPRAARMIERMEEEGLVGAPGRDGRREVIAPRRMVGAGDE